MNHTPVYNIVQGKCLLHLVYDLPKVDKTAPPHEQLGVQFKQSADYAVNQLPLPEDYEFLHYEDKGLSGYYSDRPDF